VTFNLSRRHLPLAALSAALLGAAPRLAAASPQAAAADPFALVDPELRTTAQALGALSQAFTSLSPESLAGIRALIAAQTPAFDASVPVQRRTVPGGPDGGEVVVYEINGRAGAHRPGILHIHGGGFVLGTAAAEVARLQKMAVALDCAIVTVDYRLAPETTWRGSLEDNYAGLRWLFGNVEALGVDPTRIAVMGESAGGGHAALLAIAARDRGEFGLAFQMLIYPMLDDRTASTREPPAHVGQIVWTRAANRFGWRSFLGQQPGEASVPVEAVPARTQNLSGLPPTFIGVGALDLFVTEDIDYAKRLIEAGVPTELLVVPGGFHGFDAGPADAKVVKQFNEARLAALFRGLASVKP
jgi:acetyl esterase/lipase